MFPRLRPNPSHPFGPLRSRTLVALGATVALTFGVAACSGDDDDATTPANSGNASTAPADDRSEGGEGGEGDAPDLPATGGSASLTVDGQTWEFTSLQCAFGEEETGIEGAILNMAARNGPLSLYIALEPDGDYIEIADIETDDLNLMSDGNVDATVDGKNVTATANFLDHVEYTGEALPGTLELTCP